MTIFEFDGFDIQNPNLTDSDFSWLHHIVWYMQDSEYN